MALDRQAPVTPDAAVDNPSLELSSRRTGLSFQRTRMSADRTLMSVIRTSLSLISFGFTIFHLVDQLGKAVAIAGATPLRRFGVALVVMGVAMLVLGVAYHVAFMLELRRLRTQLQETGLIHGTSGFPVSLTLIVALLLLATGLAAIVSMLLNVGPLE